MAFHQLSRSIRHFDTFIRTPSLDLPTAAKAECVLNIGAIAHKPAGNRHGTIALTGLASSSTSANRRCGGCVWREAWGRDNALAGKCVLTTDGAEIGSQRDGQRPTHAGMLARRILARQRRSSGHRPYAVAPTGSRTLKTEPLPGSLVTVTSPPIMRASLRVMARPSPVPP